MKRTISGSLLVLSLLIFFALGGAAPNEDCLQCHSDSKLTAERKGQTISLFVDGKKFSRSVHKKIECVGCHEDAKVKDFPHPEMLGPVKCGNCHDEANKEFSGSLHGKALAQKEPYAPTCAECHGNH